jgi:glucan phosphoethanolaminetransferase (alkaline phosphatase superfamily)
VSTEVATGTNWGRRALWAGIGLVLFVLAVLVTSATVPRWWAHRVGEQVDGSITQGTTLGIVYGFVFTFLPIVAIVLILRWRRTWKTIAAALAVGIVLALPNLMTLSIVIGRGNAAHAGDRILDVEAPAFRGGTLAGAVVAGLLIAFIAYLMVSRRRAETSARRARDDLREATPPPSEPPPD